jgi:SAM-dependent methyltransferase
VLLGTERAPETPSPNAIDRFRIADDYRVRREWNRYEGTAQRELFRVLRERFLRRHASRSGWTVDVGAGPGRFTPWVGEGDVRRVAVDVSPAMLRGLQGRWSVAANRPELMIADGRHLPLRASQFSEVVVLGNAVGFAGADAFGVVDAAARLVAPGGRLVVETAPGPGTTSRYLRRLPVGAVRRLLAAPVAAVAPRVDREGYSVSESKDRTRHGFRPVGEAELVDRLRTNGFTVLETVAVAPAMGGLPERLEEIRPDPKAWSRLLELEEQLGRAPKTRADAAALLLAAERPSRIDTSKIK